MALFDDDPVERMRVQMAMSLCIFVVTTAFLALFSINVPPNGDTYSYAYSITNLIGGPYHRGYDAIGYLIYTVLNPFGIDPLMILTAMSVVSGGIAVAEMFLLSLELNPSIPRALIAASALLFNGWFWVFAEHGEVYVPQLAVELAALLAVMRGYPLLSSLLFVVAVSITPTSCLLLPVLIYVLIDKKYDRSGVARFTLPLLVIFLSMMILKHRELWNMVWSSIYAPGIFIGEMTAVKAANKIALDLLNVYGRGLNLFLIIGLFGAVIMCIKERKVFLLMLLILIPFSSYILNLGLLTGDHLILTFVPASVFIACGLNQIFTFINGIVLAKIFTVAILFIIYAGISYGLFIMPFERNAREMVRVIEQFDKVADNNSVLIAEYTFGIAYWYMTQKKENRYILSGRPNDYLRMMCNKNDECANRLKNHYWINMYHMPRFLEIEIDFLKNTEKRTIYFADLKTYRSDFIKNILPEIYWKQNEGAGFVKRMSRYLSKKLGVEIQPEEVIKSPLYPIYRLEICYQ